MTTYVVLLHGDESDWAQMDETARSAVYARHEEFSTALAERGHRVTGGAQLEPSATSRVLRRSGGTVTTTEGPFAETVEQLGGYYVVDSEDLDDLLACCELLAGVEDVVEVRAAVPDTAG